MIKNSPRILLTLSSLLALGFTAAAADPSPSVTPADNSAKNERDRSGEMKTAGDQSNRSADIKTTAAIRRAVMKEKSLSMMAKNVKIITTGDGTVTLRGPVKTAEEKATIDRLAQQTAGKAKVSNLLEVKKDSK